ncbi:SRPBCC family protein [Amycolatopsis nigrescens]|uniref:SRPBCC family protein n=1 Tax=Amycolatopsis nigrescens TaxID=381445 RepID=UPI00037CB04A|nr:SRPBCC family protein [Amycolatopsis nigrescens]
MAGNAKTESGTEDGPLATLREKAAKNPVTEQLLNACQEYLRAKAERLMSTAGSKLGEASKRLAENAENAGGGSLGSLFGSKGKGGSGGKKVINIVEDIDVGVPVREAYDQWTEYQKFSSFAKGVTSADRADDTTSNWRFKVFWSNRSMKATTTEQVPDERIVWTTDGAKGTIKGAVTFHPMGENLTKILLVIEYYPAGLFEKTGNLWRAQGRRTRLDLKHFRRFVTMAGEASGEGWRGEIRNGEVVRTHEEALDAEEDEDEELPAEEDEEDEPEDEEQPRRRTRQPAGSR